MTQLSWRQVTPWCTHVCSGGTECRDISPEMFLRQIQRLQSTDCPKWHFMCSKFKHFGGMHGCQWSPSGTNCEQPFLNIIFFPQKRFLWQSEKNHGRVSVGWWKAAGEEACWWPQSPSLQSWAQAVTSFFCPPFPHHSLSLSLPTFMTFVSILAPWHLWWEWPATFLEWARIQIIQNILSPIFHYLVTSSEPLGSGCNENWVLLSLFFLWSLMTSVCYELFLLFWINSWYGEFCCCCLFSRLMLLRKVNSARHPRVCSAASCAYYFYSVWFNSTHFTNVCLSFKTCWHSREVWAALSTPSMSWFLCSRMYIRI